MLHCVQGQPLNTFLKVLLELYFTGWIIVATTSTKTYNDEWVKTAQIVYERQYNTENKLTLDCSNGEAKLCQSKEKGTHFTRWMKQDSIPFPFLLNETLTEENPSHYSCPLEQVWLGINRWKVSSVLEKVKEEKKVLENIPSYNAERETFPQDTGAD